MQACSQSQRKLTFTQVTLFLEEPINFNPLLPNGRAFEAHTR